MTSPGSENKNHSILFALRSLSLELVNEGAEKYRPNSIKVVTDVSTHPCTGTRITKTPMPPRSTDEIYKLSAGFIGHTG